ncbi:hypothetical protein ENBRE01_0099 [Enteropsectra breve]|nr:hypothetical protein ENBRE01_0099 [Enteropsectra breve]
MISQQIFYCTKSGDVHYNTPKGTVLITRDSHKSIKEIPSPELKSFGFTKILGVLKIFESYYLFYIAKDTDMGEYENVSSKKNDAKEKPCFKMPASGHTEPGTRSIFSSKNEIFKIKEVGCIPLCGSERSEMAEKICIFIKENSFYHTGGEVAGEFQWNKKMKETMMGLISQEKQQQPVSEPPAPKTKFNRKAKIKLSEIIKNFISEPRDDKMKIILCCSGDSKNESGPLQAADFLMAENLFCGYFETRRIASEVEASNKPEENSNKPVENKIEGIKIISKISSDKIGPRMLSRGIDEEGKVSFFVETSIVLECHKKKIHFTILRGSVPVFWSQDEPMKPNKIVLNGEREENNEAFKKHMDYLKNNYGEILAVDLLGHKKYERMLSKKYRDLCRDNKISYLNYDVNGHNHDMEQLKSGLYSLLDENKASSSVICRVNCMDCLDRTNLVQSLIFKYFLRFAAGDDIYELWKNNGDSLSNFYTGSDAMRGELVNKGKRSVMGRMNDILIAANRLLNNNFTDGEKQILINMLLKNI